MKMSEVWIVRGFVTDLDGHADNVKLGDTEWQFSDGPAGARGYSEDFLTLEEGLRAHSGARFHWTSDSEPALT